ncbi:hypothetical protein KSZ_77900 [Dictyobacter formicarum]|uniref:Uncharacterized protein n=1 Tax=Dictyobacter formicarum TaxID=2778368 RepID=A0ABQ3VVX3_9CHLR|nr:hypothetical protein KSZ_77900 [Dictyobacter formicarum]
MHNYIPIDTAEKQGFNVFETLYGLSTSQLLANVLTVKSV